MKLKNHILIQYLYHRRILLLLGSFFAIVDIIVGYVYQLPLERALLTIAMSGFVTIIVSIFDFYHFYQTHTKLKRLFKQENFEPSALPKNRGLIEKDYQKIIQKMYDHLQQLENNSLQSEKEILDYFTTWVHQIKVPISALHLILQDQKEEISDELDEQLFKIDQYVNLILQYVRLGSSSTDYHFQEVNLDDLIRENIKKYAPSFIRKNLALQYDPINFHIVSDPKWLSFVIEQLLSNALKYTDQGSISIYLKNQALVIEDTGIGILAEDLPRIGERNFTGFTGRQHKSATGIGFYLSKQILQKLGHHITLSSEPRKGTQVFIHFAEEEILTK